MNHVIDFIISFDSEGAQLGEEIQNITAYIFIIWIGINFQILYFDLVVQSERSAVPSVWRLADYIDCSSGIRTLQKKQG